MEKNLLDGTSPLELGFQIGADNGQTVTVTRGYRYCTKIGATGSAQMLIMQITLCLCISTD